MTRRSIPMPPWGDTPQVGPDTYDRPRSEAATRPRDPEGLPMLTSGDVAPSLGITDPNNYKHAAYGEVPHYVDTKSGDLTPTSNTRVWFSLKDIRDHFAIKAGIHLPPEKRSASQLAHGDKYEHWHNAHQKALKTEQINRESGINNGNLWNQPDPRNKDIHLRLVYGVRRYTEANPATGLVGRIRGTDSDLANPVKHGFMKPVGGESDEPTDFSNPSRPRRR